MKRIRTQNRQASGGGGSVVVVDPFEDSFSIAISADESNAVPTDEDSYEIGLDQADSNATPTETVSLGIGGHNDSAATPTETNAFTVRIWQSGSSGANVDNPTNADGENDGSVATISTAALGASTETLTSLLGANAPAGVSIASAIFRCWFSAELPLLTSTATVTLTSNGGLFSDIEVSNAEGDFLDGSFTYDLVAGGVDTSAKLSSLEVVYSTSDAVAGVSQATITVDAAAIELAAAF